MGLYDEAAGTNPSTVRPQRGRFIKEGYFDWDNPAHAKPDQLNKMKKEAVGVILPPYASYLSERVAAAKQGIPFNLPFWLAVGNHVMGARNDKDKTYVHCQRDLIRSNKVGAAYPMLDPSVAAMDDSCPICDSCWDIVWPKVKEVEGNKNSPEYKSYKDGHRQLCPQQKGVFNFLPAGSDQPVLLEAPKTLTEHITNLHYDDKQPDLLWPYAIGTFACCWVQIVREDKPDTTTYSVFPVYHNIPHVFDPTTRAFDEKRYLAIMAKIKDLREVSKAYVPSQEEMAKAIVKRDKILVFSGLAVSRAVESATSMAIAGVPGGAAASPPPTAPAPPMFPVPGAVSPGVISQPTATLPPAGLPATPPAIASAGPPPIAAPTMPAMPAASLPPQQPPTPPASAAANNAFDVLQGLLGGPNAPK